MRFPAVVLLEKLAETAVPLVDTLLDLLWTTETALFAGVATSKDSKTRERGEVDRIRDSPLNDYSIDLLSIFCAKVSAASGLQGRLYASLYEKERASNKAALCRST
jgi:hypothetical protein